MSIVVSRSAMDNDPASVPRRRRASLLFVNQAQATKRSAMGHVRVEQTLEGALPRLADPPTARFAQMPRFSRWEMGLAAPVPRVPGRGWFDLRWFAVRSLAARRLVTGAISGGDVDLVHLTSNDIALFLGDVQRRVPCVISTDVLLEDWLRLLGGVADDEPTPAPLRPLIRAEHRALRAAPLVVAWTETVAATVRAAVPGVPTATLHPGIDTELFRPRTTPQRRPGPLRVLFVGGRFDAKGGPELVEACARLGGQVELHVVTAADVPARPGVVVHRAAPGSDALVRHFQDADVFCLPSRADAVPWVVLEAMSCGVPVVSTAVGSIAEMVPGSCGRVVAPVDPDALLGALAEVVDSPQARAHMADAARAHVEHGFDAVTNTARLVALLEDVISEFGAPAR